jgi:hypothetical protein
MAGTAVLFRSLEFFHQSRLLFGESGDALIAERDHKHLLLCFGIGYFRGKCAGFLGAGEPVVCIE